MEVVNTFSIGLIDLSLGLGYLTFLLMIIYFLTFNTHNTHEIISGIAELWAFESDALKMSNS
jgi:hypothetical protein